MALGPKPRSYAQKTPKKMIQLALRSALSDRASEGRIALIDQWTFEIPSTKAALAALAALGLSGRVLVVLGEEDGYADRSFGNLPEIQTIVAGELNAYDVLVNDWVLFTDATLPGAKADVAGAAPAAPSAATAADDSAATAADDSAATAADDDKAATAADDAAPAGDAAGEEEGAGS